MMKRTAAIEAARTAQARNSLSILAAVPPLREVYLLPTLGRDIHLCCGVAVTPSEAFVAGREDSPHAVRICLGAPRSRTQLEKGLTIVRGLLKGAPDPCLSIL